MKDPRSERAVHAVARGVSATLWVIGDWIGQSGSRIERVGWRIHDAGHWVVDQATRYSDRIHGAPPGPPPPLILTKIPLPPISLIRGDNLPVGLVEAKSVSVRSKDGLINCEIPILDRKEGTVDLAGVVSLPVGDYEIQVDGKHYTVGNGIQLRDQKEAG